MKSIEPRRFIAFLVLVVWISACGVMNAVGAQSSASPLLWGPNLGAPGSTSVAVSWQSARLVAVDLHYGLARVVDTTGQWDETLTFERQEGHAEVWLRDLLPGTTYRYQVVVYEGDAVTSSEVGSFRTLSADQRAMQFVVYGSSRGRPELHRMVADAVRAGDAEADLLIHAGDLVAVPTLEHFANHYWATGDLAFSRPMVFVVGDHEHGAEMYYELMTLPHGGGTSREQWWSIDFGGLRMIGLDSTVAGDEIAMATQTEWLRGILTSPAAGLTVVVLHHGLYGASYMNGRNHEVATVWEDLFVQGGVRLVLSGDATCYEHVYRRGIHHVNSGGGGAPLMEEPNRVAPGTVSRRYGLLHYVRVSLADEALRVEAVPVASVSSGGAIYAASEGTPFDTFVIRLTD